MSGNKGLIYTIDVLIAVMLFVSIIIIDNKLDNAIKIENLSLKELNGFMGNSNINDFAQDFNYCRQYIILNNAQIEERLVCGDLT